MQRIARPYCCISVGPEPELGTVRTVLIAREIDGQGPAPIELVVLAVHTGGRVYLAAWVDRDDRVIEWLEWWVQSPHELSESPTARAGLVTNSGLDDQWTKTHRALAQLVPEDAIGTGWEKLAAHPLAVDLRARRVVRLVTLSSGSALEVCREDNILKAAGLGLYSETLERWFRSLSPAGDASWLSVNDVRPTASADRVAVSEAGAEAPLSEFNSGAGFMSLRRHHPFSLEGFLRWLDRSAGTATAEPAASTAANAIADDDAGVSLPETMAVGEWRQLRRQAPITSDGSALEEAFIRLSLWLTAVKEVYAASMQMGCPFLNLSTDSFRVSVPTRSQSLPPAWLVNVVLVQTGESIPIRLGEIDAGFVPAGGTPTTPHALPKFGGCREGSGTMRIRQASDLAGGRAKLDGVLDGNEIRNAAPGDFVWVQTQVEGRSWSFFAKLDEDVGGARAGMPFTAMSVDISQNAVSRLKAAARHPCNYIVYRPVSPVFDIFSLGTVGLRIFLSANRSAIGDLVEDFFELATLVSKGEGVDGLRRLATTSEIGDRCRTLLGLPGWAVAKAGRSTPALSESVWFAILNELLEFVAAEAVDAPTELTASALAENSVTPSWLVPLQKRVVALEELTIQVRTLMLAPRGNYDEVARVIHSFV